MKVAHFIDTHSVGGAETLVVETTRNLNKRNWQTTILHFGNTWIEKKSAEYGISTVLLPGYSHYKSIKTLPFFAYGLGKFLRQSDIDVLHSHLVDPISGASLGAFLSHTPHIGTLHDIHTLQEQPRKLWLLKIAAALGTKLVAVSEDIENHIANNVRFLKKDIQTIYNGIDIQRFAADDIKSVSLMEDLGLKKDDFVYICVGRLVEVKDHETLIQAFKKCNFNQHAKLLIVGDGPLKPRIEKFIVKCGVGDSVRMLGLRNDIPALLNISDCFVLASLSEGLSCSIIEAMVAGLPIIATQVGGNSELVQDGNTGHLVFAKNPDAFAEKMRKMYEDKNRRRQMAAKAKMIACEKFSMETMLEKYALEYEKILGRSRS